MKVKIIKKHWPENPVYDLRGRTGQAVGVFPLGHFKVRLDPPPCGIENDRTPRVLWDVPEHALEVVA